MVGTAGEMRQKIQYKRGKMTNAELVRDDMYAADNPAWLRGEKQQEYEARYKAQQKEKRYIAKLERQRLREIKENNAFLARQYKKELKNVLQNA